VIYFNAENEHWASAWKSTLRLSTYTELKWRYQLTHVASLVSRTLYTPYISPDPHTSNSALTPNVETRIMKVNFIPTIGFSPISSVSKRCCLYEDLDWYHAKRSISSFIIGLYFRIWWNTPIRWKNLLSAQWAVVILNARSIEFNQHYMLIWALHDPFLDIEENTKLVPPFLTRISVISSTSIIKS